MTYILGQNRWQIYTRPPPTSPQNQRWKIGAFWLLRGFILVLGERGFAVPFYSVQDGSLVNCILYMS